MRIVYMGTPEFAIAPLRALIKEGMDIIAVITAPDKPAGRGRKIQQSAVKQFAFENLDCPILQPENLKDKEFEKQLLSLRPELFIVVAFRMLPQSIWSMPTHGTFNLHASLLPQYRGAAPINHAIINGETLTGVTTFLIDAKIDTGRILFRQEVKIEPGDNAGSLHDKLMIAGADLVVKTVKSIKNEDAEPFDQESFNIPDSELKKAPKIFKEDCKIRWDMPLTALHNLIRGLSPYPAAYSELFKPGEEKILCKIYSGISRIEKHDLQPGTILTDHKSYIHVAVKQGFYELLSLQLAGKKRMNADELLRGFNGDISKYRFT